MIIKIFHAELRDAEIQFDDNNEKSEIKDSSATWIVPYVPESVEILFEPFGITPKLWIDNFLINFWLADVQQQDHKLIIPIGNDFFEKYRIRDGQGRLQSLGVNPDPILVDKIVGRNFHQLLVDDIKLKLDEKRNLS